MKNKELGLPYYDAGKNRGLEIAIALLEGNESQVIDQAEKVKL